MILKFCLFLMFDRVTLPAFACWLPEEMVVGEARALAQTLGLFSESEENTVLTVFPVASRYQIQIENCYRADEKHEEDE